MTRIAIIGGIGSGKSEVLAVAKDMGYDILSADKINAELLQDSDYISKIDKAFVGVVKAGQVDKNALAKAIFADESKRKLLNSIAHKEIMARIFSAESARLAVEIPLFLESESSQFFDEILLVKAPFLKRLKMLKKRGLSAKRALKIIKTQAKTADLEKYATIVIENKSDKNSLREATQQVFN